MIILLILFTLTGFIITYQDLKELKVDLWLLLLHLSFMVGLIVYSEYYFILPLCFIGAFLLFLPYNTIDFTYLIITVLTLWTLKTSQYFITLLIPLELSLLFVMLSRREKVPFLSVICPLLSFSWGLVFIE